MKSLTSTPRRLLLVLSVLSLSGCANMGSLGQVLGGLGLPGGGSEVSGQVTYVDTRSQQVELQASNGQTIALGYDSNTQVVYQNQRYAVTNLERGDYVTARIQQDSQGRSYTDLITVEQSVSGDANTGNGGYGTGNLQIFEGRVGTVDLQRGFFELQPAYGGRYTVTMPYNPPASELDRFRRIRSGDTVRLEGTLLAQDRIELYRFR